MTAQITNEWSGSSPQTEALLSLTPQGLNYGDSTTVGIGTITVPPLGPYQTINLVQNITLPAVEPARDRQLHQFRPDHDPGRQLLDQRPLSESALPGGRIRPDGDHHHHQLDLHGHDRPTPRPGRLLGHRTRPARSNGARPSRSPPTSRTSDKATPAPFQVFYLLTGQAGSITDAIYLGQTDVSSLAAGADDPITQSLTLPTRLPSGVTLNSVGYARIAVIVDPNNFINESLKSNNQTISAPFIVRLPGNQSTVPTTTRPVRFPPVAQVAQQASERDQSPARPQARGQGPGQEGRGTPRRNSAADVRPSSNSVVDKTVSLAEEVGKLPHQIASVLEKSV